MDEYTAISTLKATPFVILLFLLEHTDENHQKKVSEINDEIVKHGIKKLDVKTITTDIEMLNSLDLGIEIEHKKNKGYFIKKRLIDSNYRNVLIELIKNAKNVSVDLKQELLNFVTLDSSKIEKNQCQIVKYNEKKLSNLAETIEIIKQAIEDERNISFEYLSYNSSGDLKKDGITYIVSPKEIRCVNGIYYLYTNDFVWLHDSNKVKLQYMINVKKTNTPVESLLIKTEKKFIFEIELLYEWTIELIEENFDKYKIIKDKSRIYCTIETVYDKAVQWSKLYGKYFIIKNENLFKEVLHETSRIAQHFLDNDIIQMKIKAAIVNHYNNNKNVNLQNVKQFFKNQKLVIDDYLGDIGFQYIEAIDDVFIYKNHEEKIGVQVVGIDIYTYYDETKNVSVVRANKNVRKYADLANELRSFDCDKKYLIVFGETSYNRYMNRPYAEKIRLTTNKKAIFQEFMILSLKPVKSVRRS